MLVLQIPVEALVSATSLLLSYATTGKIALQILAISELDASTQIRPQELRAETQTTMRAQTIHVMRLECAVYTLGSRVSIQTNAQTIVVTLSLDAYTSQKIAQILMSVLQTDATLDPDALIH